MHTTDRNRINYDLNVLEPPPSSHLFPRSRSRSVSGPGSGSGIAGSGSDHGLGSPGRSSLSRLLAVGGTSPTNSLKEEEGEEEKKDSSSAPNSTTVEAHSFENSSQKQTKEAASSDDVEQSRISTTSIATVTAGTMEKVITVARELSPNILAEPNISPISPKSPPQVTTASGSGSGSGPRSYRSRTSSSSTFTGAGRAKQLVRKSPLGVEGMSGGGTASPKAVATTALSRDVGVDILGTSEDRGETTGAPSPAESLSEGVLNALYSRSQERRRTTSQSRTNNPNPFKSFASSLGFQFGTKEREGKVSPSLAKDKNKDSVG